LMAGMCLVRIGVLVGRHWSFSENPHSG
jgi:hypothetical protein